MARLLQLKIFLSISPHSTKFLSLLESGHIIIMLKLSMPSEQSCLFQEPWWYMPAYTGLKWPKHLSGPCQLLVPVTFLITSLRQAPEYLLQISSPRPAGPARDSMICMSGGALCTYLKNHYRMKRYQDGNLDPTDVFTWEFRSIMLVLFHLP